MKFDPIQRFTISFEFWLKVHSFLHFKSWSPLRIRTNPNFFLLLLGTKMKVNILRILPSHSSSFHLLPLSLFYYFAFYMFLSLLPFFVFFFFAFKFSCFYFQPNSHISRIGYLWKRKRICFSWQRSLLGYLLYFEKEYALCLSLLNINFHIMMNLFCLLGLSNYSLAEVSGCLYYHICWDRKSVV